MGKAYKPLKPMQPPPWGISAELVQKQETARVKFLDLACDLVIRLAKVDAYLGEVQGKLDIAIALAELPEQMSARAWVWLAMNQSTQGVYN